MVVIARPAGGAGTDRLFGGMGNDYLNPGDNTNFDYINPHSGADTVDATGMQTGFLSIKHWDLVFAEAQSITVDGVLNSGSIDKGLNGVTYLVGMFDAMEADGLGIDASSFDDEFNVNASDNGFLQLSGGAATMCTTSAPRTASCGSTTRTMPRATGGLSRGWSRTWPPA